MIYQSLITVINIPRPWRYQDSTPGPEWHLLQLLDIVSVSLVHPKSSSFLITIADGRRDKHTEYSFEILFTMDHDEPILAPSAVCNAVESQKHLCALRQHHCRHLAGKSSRRQNATEFAIHQFQSSTPSPIEMEFRYVRF